MKLWVGVRIACQQAEACLPDICPGRLKAVYEEKEKATGLEEASLVKEMDRFKSLRLVDPELMASEQVLDQLEHFKHWIRTFNSLVHV